MYAVKALLGLMFLMWGTAIWASFRANGARDGTD